MRKKLPVITADEALLDRVGIATPCDTRWESMKGDERVRHCPACRLNVYNISAMSRREAATLIRQREGRLCVRLYRRGDGTLLTADCWEKLRAARRRGVLAFAAAVLVVGFTQIALRVFGVELFFALPWAPPPIAAMEATSKLAAPETFQPRPMPGELRADPTVNDAPPPPSPATATKPPKAPNPPSTKDRAKPPRGKKPTSTHVVMGKMYFPPAELE